MTKTEKNSFVDELAEKFKQKPSFLLIDTGGMTVAKMNDLRRTCFKSGIEVKIAKNTLIKKALEKQGLDYSPVFPYLKQNTTILFCDEVVNVPAKVLLDYRGKAEVPAMKAAFVESSLFVGDASLKVISSLKTKTELLGEVIGLLQSPAQNVISALQSAGQTIHGVLKTLEEKKS